MNVNKEIKQHLNKPIFAVIASKTGVNLWQWQHNKNTMAAWLVNVKETRCSSSTKFDNAGVYDLLIPFAAHTIVETPNGFERAGQDNTLNCPFQWGSSWPHQLYGCLDPCESITQKPSQSVQLFLHTTPLWPKHKTVKTHRHTPRYVRHL